MSAPAPKLQAWGQLKPGTVYIKRPLDDELEHWISTGKSCVVTASRQAGKSSLRARLAEHLRQNQGIVVCSIDLSRESSSYDGDWYRTLFREIWKQIEKQIPVSQGTSLDEFLIEHQAESWVQTWRTLILELAKWSQAKKGLVLLFDEVESALERRSFFAGLRAAHDELSERQGFRFAFCLLGVLATSGQLLSEGLQLVLKLPDLQRTPLPPFERQDLDGFLPALQGFVKSPHDPHKLLNAIYDWTNGQPYHTHRILYELRRRGALRPGPEAGVVQEVVEQIFLRKDMADDDFLAYAQHRIKAERRTDAGTTRIESLLRLYHRVRLQAQLVRYQPNDPLQQELLLLGICRVDGDCLVSASRITQAVFDAVWIEQELTSSWFEDQYQAWHRSGALPEQRATAKLLRGDDLKKASEWIKHQGCLSDAERNYIQRSRDAQVHKENRQRRALFALSLLVPVAIALLLTLAVSFRGVLRLKEIQVRESEQQKEEVTKELATAKERILELERQHQLLLRAEAEVRGSLKDRDLKIATLTTEMELAVHDIAKQRELIDQLDAQRHEAHGLRQQLAATQDLARELKQKLDQIKLTMKQRVEALAYQRSQQGDIPAVGAKTPLLFQHPDPVTAAILVGNGTQMVTGTNKGQIFFWDTVKAVHLTTQSCHVARVASLVASPDDHYVASAGRDGRICIFDRRRIRLLAKLDGHIAGVSAIAFSSTGKLLLSGGEDKTVKLWDAPSGKLQANLRQDRTVTAVAFSGNDRYLMLGDAGSSMHWIERTDSGALLRKDTLTGHIGYISFLWVNESATRSLVGTSNGVVYSWNLDVAPPFKTDNVALMTRMHTINKKRYGRSYKGEVLDIQRLTNGFYSLSIDDTGVTWIWETFTGLPMQELANPRPEGAGDTWRQKVDNTARFSRDGKYVVTGSDDGYARVWRIKTKDDGAKTP